MSLRGVCYSYTDRTTAPVFALSGINLEIEAGDFLCVLGPNGSGKSTFGRLLNALLIPTEGEVLVDGLDTRDSRNTWAIRQRVGMVFQNPDNQIVGTQVEEDVAFGLENLGIPRQEMRRRVEENLTRVGMLAYRQHPPHLLSGGQKQRVAIAGVLAMQPQSIVLDEATSLLDPKGRLEVRKILVQLHHEGVTLILITHLMEEALLADKLVILNEGRIVLSGSPQEVFGQSEMLRHCHLEAPTVVRLAQALRDQSVALPNRILQVEELVDELCVLKRSI
ncbi:MAG: energy-coupling factor transporter ATPase [Coprothermobacterota bacterium]|nr:energy-coupling factor transporter ATPase [Coprothermobacterota bacterium]